MVESYAIRPYHMAPSAWALAVHTCKDYAQAEKAITVGGADGLVAAFDAYKVGCCRLRVC